MMALEKLDSEVGEYPKGFLEQFKNGAGEGGLRFMLTGPIQSETGVMGYHYNQGHWYNIVIDISLNDIGSTVHHELFHAIENKVAAVTGGSFYDGSWDHLNPVGFEYCGTYDYYDMDYSEQNRWTYMGDNGDEIFFVDTYSKTFPAEDRARIMEYVMSFDKAATAFMKGERMKAKLRVMSEKIRLGFNTEGWDNLPWERYL